MTLFAKKFLIIASLAFASLTAFAGGELPCEQVLSGKLRVALTIETETNLDQGYKDLNGQAQAAAESFEGNMLKAYTAAVEIFGEQKVRDVLRWKPLNMHALLYHAISNTLLDDITMGTHKYGFVEGYIRFARAHFSGDMAKAFDAAAEVFGKVVIESKLAWQRINLSANIYEMVESALRDAFRSTKVHPNAFSDGYMRFAEKYFGGKMDLAFDAAAEVFSPEGVAMRLRWKRLDITTETFNELRGILHAEIAVEESLGLKEPAGFEKFAEQHFKGDRRRAYQTAIGIVEEKDILTTLHWLRINGDDESAK